MYEFEVNHQRLTAKTIPVEVVTSLAQLNGAVQAISLLPWEEHCTECAMPVCYSTCNLYEPRKDGKCRRFLGGITSISGINNSQGYLVRVSFKRWGQLLAYANIHAIPIKRIRWIEKVIFFLDFIASHIPDRHLEIKGRAGVTSRLQGRLKHAIARSGIFKKKNSGPPTYFFIESYSPNNYTVKLTLTIKADDPDKYSAGFQELLEIHPGYNKFIITMNKIENIVDLSEKFAISLNPNIVDEKNEGMTLYFGMLTFVWEDARHAKLQSGSKMIKKAYVKVVVWDLDNTIWNGVLLEDGIDKLRLKPGIVDIIKEFDRRGILNSVVSKNNRDDAISALDKFGLTKFMLNPQIGWEQKGRYVRSLVKLFNVAENTFAFIDDQPFERDEVLSLNPEVRVYDALQYDTLLDVEEFNPPLSAESHLRREFYTVEKQREQESSSFDGQYFEFLRDCQIKLNIFKPGSGNIERIMELVLRTNQLNFSGNRYSLEDISKIISQKRYDAYCLDCNDRYGQYGMVGFAIVNKDKCQLIDLMFSCRIQSKRVEHAFLACLLKHYQAEGKKEFSTIYRKTDRNKKAGGVFEDMGFIQGEGDNESMYTFDLASSILSDGIIDASWNGKPCLV